MVNQGPAAYLRCVLPKLSRQLWHQRGQFVFTLVEEGSGLAGWAAGAGLNLQGATGIGIHGKSSPGHKKGTDLPEPGRVVLQENTKEQSWGQLPFSLKWGGATNLQTRE